MGFGKNQTGVIIKEDTTLTVGAFTSKTAKLIGNLVLGEDFRMLKAEVQAWMDGLTSGEADDIYFGIANGELSIAEIAAAISTDGPNDRNDRAAEELAMRNVRLFGVLRLQESAAIKGPFVDRSDSALMEHRIRWTYSNPEGWNYFVFNNGTILTTGSSIRMLAKNYGVWVQ